MKSEGTDRKDARKILWNGRLMPMIGCLILVICGMMAPVLITLGLLGAVAVFVSNELLYGMLIVLMICTILASFVFFGIPLSYAVYRMAYGVARGEPCRIWDAVSWVFRDGNYVRVLLCGLMLLLRILLIIGTIVGGMMIAFSSVSFDVAGFFGLLFYGVLTCLAVLGLLWLGKGWYFVPYGLCCGMTLSQAVRYSRDAAAKRRTELTFRSISHIPLYLLSLLSIGILYILDTAPTLAVSYILLNEKSDTQDQE